jgi:hypothetical protein
MKFGTSMDMSGSHIEPMSNIIVVADWQIQAKNAHLTSNESHFVEDTKDLLVLHMPNWVHIKLLNDAILITPSLSHQNLLDV